MPTKALTDRQLEIIEKMRLGWTQRQIAAHLGITPQRVNQLVNRRQFQAILAAEAKAKV